MPVKKKGKWRSIRGKEGTGRSTLDREKEAMRSRLGAIDLGLNNALIMIGRVESDLNYVEGQIATLPARLSKLRSQGFECLSYLEKNQDLLVEKWGELGPPIKQDFLGNIQPLRGEVNRLRSEVNRLRAKSAVGNLGQVSSSSSALSLMASTLRSRTASETSKIDSSLKEFKSNVSSIDEELKIAESSMEWFSQASFPLKGGESPILALKAKIMKGDKKDGTLYFTNHRFIFEGMKEIVLKRTLFFATKKKKIKTVLIDQPIGIIKEISEGRVGLIAWAGIYVRFKPDSGVEETPFDVKGEEIPTINRFFNYIISGEADIDIATFKGKTPIASRTQIKILRCPTCSAPYTSEVYRGQTSVQCKYCGGVISVAG